MVVQISAKIGSFNEYKAVRAKMLSVTSNQVTLV